jgi:predicted aspartyl protease
MPTLDFSVEHDYRAGPDDHSAEVQIRIIPPGGVPMVITGILDTGAALSMFDKSLVPFFGIQDLTTGNEIEITAANNQTEKAYVHELEIEFLGKRLTVPVGFCPNWPDGTPNLLGMKGFFEQLHVAFKHNDRLVLVAFP